MGETTAIAWTRHTFNPWIGCSKVHTGCLNCYVETDFDKRRHVANWGWNGTRVRTKDAYWQKPLKWNADASRSGCKEDGLVFCASLADVFEIDLDWGLTKWRNELFELIDKTPFLTWQLLTKRPEQIAYMWPFLRSGDVFRRNVWLGVSVSDARTADEMIPRLLACQYLAQNLFVSYEPAIGQVDFTPWIAPKLPRIDWVIVGGESGLSARPCHQAWIDDVLDQCESNCPVFVKQLGKYSVVGNRFEKLIDKKGGDMDEWPKHLRVRQMPNEW